MKYIKLKGQIIVFIVFIFLSSCSKEDVIKKNDSITPIDNLSIGSGLFSYSYDRIDFKKNLKIYYYIPKNKTATTPILFVFHGTGRNAEDYRNTLISKAELLGFIVIAPEFSEQNFPEGDGYNLGNVFIDGDNPSTNTLNPEAQWSFSIVEPVFDYVKAEINNTNTKYHIFGHSAGGQFVHRFMMFKPKARVEKAVVSGSGWYTFPNTISFPYGINQSPLENIDKADFLSKKIYIQIGDNDDDPNAFGLRHNGYADAQGLNRKDRAIYFYQFCQELSINNNFVFNWSFHYIDNSDHDYIKASDNAATLLFN